MVYLPVNLGCAELNTHIKNIELQLQSQIMHLEGAFQGVF
jgi:hypothetical protein